MEQDSIEARRKAKGLTLNGLAVRARVKWQQLRDIEDGRRKPRAATLRRIERALRRAPSS